ncbi:DoxX family protein [Candidatus Woesearchaeota archaeon]|nr:DoxX family protein [Candidatus Woesearchaeota archaeon]
MAKKNNLNGWSLTLLRVVLGVIFLYHGYLKLFVAGGFTGTVNFLASLGVPVPLYSALAVSVVEFAGGLFLILGVVTRWSSVLLLANMLVALFLVHLKNGLLVSNGGYEFVLVLIAGLVVVLASGAGKLSAGSMLKNKQLQ